MELLFVFLGGAIFGTIARYTLPHRDEHGSVLVPAIGAVVASVVWVALTWLGWAWDGGWIWWVSLGASVIAVVVADLAIGRHRVQTDAALLTKLTGSTATATAH
ncbi:hypothetical protein WJX64_02420 [Leifsonia sp. YIM 134122]|uniref:Integral membrane protein n=1 Tax=Leifsonia stereocauli TaxID=3134136 RepID=A0ABU9W079_9MICO